MNASSRWVACECCDLLVEIPPLIRGRRADCPDCGLELERDLPGAVEKTLALSVASLLLYVVAQSATFMSFELDGLSQNAQVLTGIFALFADGKWPLASLILLTAVVAPLLWILVLLYLAVPMQFGRLPPAVVPAMRFRAWISSWSMLEVFLLAVLVTYVKLVSVASIGIGPGAWTFAGLLVTTTWAGAAFDARLVWDRLEGEP